MVTLCGMERYDPEMPPAPEVWLALDEDERVLLVKEFHRRSRERAPNAVLHASMHVVVENQIAMGESPPVTETLERLISEGLDRHDAIHAVASVLAEHMYTLMKKPGDVPGDPNQPYYDGLSRLTADDWRSGS